VVVPAVLDPGGVPRPSRVRGGLRREPAGSDHSHNRRLDHPVSPDHALYHAVAGSSPGNIGLIQYRRMFGLLRSSTEPCISRPISGSTQFFVWHDIVADIEKRKSSLWFLGFVVDDPTGHHVDEGNDPAARQEVDGLSIA